MAPGYQLLLNLSWIIGEMRPLIKIGYTPSNILLIFIANSLVKSNSLILLNLLMYLLLSKVTHFYLGLTLGLVLTEFQGLTLWNPSSVFIYISVGSLVVSVSISYSVLI